MNRTRQITIRLTEAEAREVAYFRDSGNLHLSHSEAYRQLLLRGIKAYRGEAPRPSRYFVHNRGDGLFELRDMATDEPVGVHRRLVALFAQKDRLEA